MQSTLHCIQRWNASRSCHRAALRADPLARNDGSTTSFCRFFLLLYPQALELISAAASNASSARVE
jgi:hypothetical protein